MRRKIYGKEAVDYVKKYGGTFCMHAHYDRNGRAVYYQEDIPKEKVMEIWRNDHLNLRHVFVEADPQKDGIPEETWIMELRTKDGWRPIKATWQKDPYQYGSKIEALKMLEICYPEQCREERLGDAPVVRVRKI